MVVSELRIGNFIDLGNRIAKVSEIYGKAITALDLEETQDTIESLDRCNPIPLSEQWLIDLGFELTYDSFFRQKYDHKEHSEIGFDYSKDEPIGLEGFRYYGHYIKIEFVHQAQNLYFALTGQELTYNQNTLSK